MFPTQSILSEQNSRFDWQAMHTCISWHFEQLQKFKILCQLESARICYTAYMYISTCGCNKLPALYTYRLSGWLRRWEKLTSLCHQCMETCHRKNEKPLWKSSEPETGKFFLPSFNNLPHTHSRVLITTDVWARGLDVQQVSLVINYDLPNSRELYIHRLAI